MTIQEFARNTMKQEDLIALIYNGGVVDYFEPIDMEKKRHSAIASLNYNLNEIGTLQEAGYTVYDFQVSYDDMITIGYDPNAKYEFAL